jgi:hypothetical protein
MLNKSFEKGENYLCCLRRNKKFRKNFDEISKEPMETIMQGLCPEIEVMIHVKIKIIAA